MAVPSSTSPIGFTLAINNTGITDFIGNPYNSANSNRPTFTAPVTFPTALTADDITAIDQNDDDNTVTIPIAPQTFIQSITIPNNIELRIPKCYRI